jgi:hypothetical protein
MILVRSISWTLKKEMELKFVVFWIVFRWISINIWWTKIKYLNPCYWQRQYRVKSSSSESYVNNLDIFTQYICCTHKINWSCFFSITMYGQKLLQIAVILTDFVTEIDQSICVSILKHLFLIILSILRRSYPKWLNTLLKPLTAFESEPEYYKFLVFWIFIRW